jgi:4-hydroxybenzoate polyprenyltransferase/phosphoserine phosphatase
MPNMRTVTPDLQNAPSDAVPLCVDLDGTLIRSDVLVEGYLRCVKLNVMNALLALWWLLRGKAHLKAEIARRVSVDPALLPVNEEFVNWLKKEHAGGRRLVLCTAANQTDATRIAEYFGIFDTVISSDATTNLSGATKAAALVNRFGKGGFDYAGNESKDMYVWAQARHAIVVSPSSSLRRQLATIQRVEQTFSGIPVGLSVWMRGLRVHQWTKNVLVFVPVLASHRFLESHVLIAAALAFLWFGLCASGTYLINDLMDLDADRMHARKRSRPLASGALPLPLGIVGAFSLILAAFIGAWFTLGGHFTAVLLLYLVATLWYSFVLKRIAMVDALSLAGLYTVRVIAGSAATTIVPSFWLLAFSMFLFLSLAMVKRYTELRSVLMAGKSVAAGRGYTTDDLPLLLSCGISSGFVSILVLALYINVGASQLYRDPHALWLLCPLLLYWICRVWRKTHRGELHDDPVVFALRDRPSMLVGVLCALLMWAATQTYFNFGWIQ